MNDKKTNKYKKNNAMIFIHINFNIQYEDKTSVK